MSEQHKIQRMGVSFEQRVVLSSTVLSPASKRGSTAIHQKRKRNSTIWKHPGSPVSTKLKATTSAREVMAIVFWNSKGNYYWLITFTKDKELMFIVTLKLYRN